MEKGFIRTEDIQLDQFLKLCGAVATGGEVKPLVASGSIFIDEKPVTERRKKLHPGDVVTLLRDGTRESYEVVRKR